MTMRSVLITQLRLTKLAKNTAYEELPLREANMTFKGIVHAKYIMLSHPRVV